MLLQNNSLVTRLHENMLQLIYNVLIDPVGRGGIGSWPLPSGGIKDTLDIIKQFESFIIIIFFVVDTLVCRPKPDKDKNTARIPYPCSY